MSSPVYIRPLGPDHYQWSANPDACQHGDIADLVNDVSQYAESDPQLILLLPDEQVVLKTAHFNKDERKLLRQTVPYSLEEEFSNDVDQLHFALAKPADDHVAVAVVDQQRLRDWLTPFQHAQLALAAVLPESLVLPWQPGQWHILLEEGRVLIRTHYYKGFAVPQDTSELAFGNAGTGTGRPAAANHYQW